MNIAPIRNSKTAPLPKMITPEDLAKTGSEDGHQAAVMCWAALNRPTYPQLKWLHAIPNGGSRHIVEAMKMVGTGTRSGILDLFLPWPSLKPNDSRTIHSFYHGLYIEMKVEKHRDKEDGGLTKQQVYFKAYADNVGYKTAVCYSWQEARDEIISYLELK